MCNEGSEIGIAGMTKIKIVVSAARTMQLGNPELPQFSPPQQSAGILIK